MIKQFPNASIPVTWDNVMRQVKLRFGHEFRRNVLSQKVWDGRKLIAEAFQDAKKIQGRLARDTAPKYANEPRSRLRQIVAKLQSENLALREQLDQVRAQQYDEIHSLLDTRTPLSRLGATRSDPRRETVASVGEVKARRSRKVANNGTGNSAPGK
jgi:predicted membrane chloride channel (bestrophin family)